MPEGYLLWLKNNRYVNTHVSETVWKKYPNIDFRGKPKTIKDRTVIKAINVHTGMAFYYSFEEDFFWLINCGFSIDSIPDWKIN